MRPKHQRLTFILSSLIVVAIAVGFILQAFEDNLVFFYSPTDLKEKGLSPNEYIRVGGLVKENSIKWEKISDNKKILHFILTDKENDIAISFDKTPPALFREGQGIVAEGKMDSKSGSFIASRILAKHDENYMPAEVVRSLKDSGHWQKDEQKQAE